MGYYSDIYVIKKVRSKNAAIDFLDHCLPQRKENSNFYEVPRFEKKVELEFDNVDELMDYLEEKDKVSHCIYWRNMDDENLNRHGMIFYTSDSYMIFGISRDSYGIDNTKNEDNCLREMKNFINSEDGYITYECPPEETDFDFIRKVSEFNQSVI